MTFGLLTLKHEIKRIETVARQRPVGRSNTSRTTASAMKTQTQKDYAKSGLTIQYAIIELDTPTIAPMVPMKL
jgi:hypothetical protein